MNMKRKRLTASVLKVGFVDNGSAKLRTARQAVAIAAELLGGDDEVQIEKAARGLLAKHSPQVIAAMHPILASAPANVDQNDEVDSVCEGQEPVHEHATEPNTAVLDTITNETNPTTDVKANKRKASDDESSEKTAGGESALGNGESDMVDDAAAPLNGQSPEVVFDSVDGEDEEDAEGDDEESEDGDDLDGDEVVDGEDEEDAEGDDEESEDEEDAEGEEAGFFGDGEGDGEGDGKELDDDETEILLDGLEDVNGEVFDEDEKDPSMDDLENGLGTLLDDSAPTLARKSSVTRQSTKLPRGRSAAKNGDGFSDLFGVSAADMARVNNEFSM